MKKLPTEWDKIFANSTSIKVLISKMYGSSLVAQQSRICLQYRRHRLILGNIPCRRELLPTPVFLPGEFRGWRSLAGYSPWVTKSQRQLSDEHFHFFYKLLYTQSDVKPLGMSPEERITVGLIKRAES